MSKAASSIRFVQNNVLYFLSASSPLETIILDAKSFHFNHKIINKNKISEPNLWPISYPSRKVLNQARRGLTVLKKVCVNNNVNKQTDLNTLMHLRVNHSTFLLHSTKMIIMIMMTVPWNSWEGKYTSFWYTCLWVLSIFYQTGMLFEHSN